MEGLQGPAFLFAVALLFSLLIERLLEIVKCVVDLLDSRFDWHRFWSRRAEKLGKKLEQQLRMNDSGDMKIFKVIIKNKGIDFYLNHIYNYTILLSKYMLIIIN